MTFPIRFIPRQTGSVHLGGIVRRAAHPKNPGGRLKRRSANGGAEPRWTPRLFHELACMRHGRTVLSGRNSQLDGKARRAVRRVAMSLDPKFFLEFGGLRGHQVHLEGGDASSDSYCLL